MYEETYWVNVTGSSTQCKWQTNILQKSNNSLHPLIILLQRWKCTCNGIIKLYT